MSNRLSVFFQMDESRDHLYAQASHVHADPIREETAEEEEAYVTAPLVGFALRTSAGSDEGKRQVV